VILFLSRRSGREPPAAVRPKPQKIGLVSLMVFNRFPGSPPENLHQEHLYLRLLLLLAFKLFLHALLIASPAAAVVPFAVCEVHSVRRLPLLHLTSGLQISLPFLALGAFSRLGTVSAFDNLCLLVTLLGICLLGFLGNRHDTLWYRVPAE